MWELLVLGNSSPFCLPVMIAPDHATLQFQHACSVQWLWRKLLSCSMAISCWHFLTLWQAGHKRVHDWWPNSTTVSMNHDQNMIFSVDWDLCLYLMPLPQVKKFANSIFSTFICLFIHTYIHTHSKCACASLVHLWLACQTSDNKAKKTTSSPASEVKHCCKKYYNE